MSLKRNGTVCVVVSIVFSLFFSFLACENPLIEQIWELKTVVFETNGGTPVSGQMLLKGEPVKRPPDPEKESYKFTNWFNDDTLQTVWDFDVAPKKDLTLFAGWRFYGLVLSPIQENDVLDFGTFELGYSYADITEQQVVVTNTTDDKIELIIDVANTALFNVLPNAPFTLLTEEEHTITVSPLPGADVGEHTATFTIKGGGYSLSFGARFRVMPGTVIDLVLVREPDKLIYDHGEKLDLTGLEVSLVYSGGYTENVTFTQFVSRGIDVNLADGTVLSNKLHDGSDIIVSYNNSYFVNAGTLTVNTITLDDVNFPAASAIKFGMTLADSELTGGDTHLGSFAWKDSTIEPSSVGIFNYEVVFTPDDTESCDFTGIADWDPVTETITREVSITVNPAIIYDAIITVTAPVKNAVPDATAVVQAGSNFTASAVTWSPADDPYLTSTEYTATVTLTANSNYTFTGGLTGTVTINGYNAVVKNNTGSAVDLEYEFPATAAKEVTGISIISQPAKMIYTHGDTLELSGFEVRLTYDDLSYEDVELDDFDDFDITINFPDGTELIHIIHDGLYIVVEYGDLPSASTTTPLTVSRNVIDDVNFPTASQINLGETLADSELTGGSTNLGSFSWEDSTIEPFIGDSSYNVVFTPNDPDNNDYSGIMGWDAGTKTIIRTVSITVIEAPGEFETNITYIPITDINETLSDEIIGYVGTGLPRSIKFELSDGPYSEIKWYVNNTEIDAAKDEEEFTMTAGDGAGEYKAGTYFVAVEVIKNGVPYNKTVTVKVLEEEEPPSPGWPFVINIPSPPNYEPGVSTTLPDLESNAVLSKTGAGGKPKSAQFEVANPGSYEHIDWRFGGESLGSDGTLTITVDSADPDYDPSKYYNVPGNHTITIDLYFYDDNNILVYWTMQIKFKVED